VDVRVSAAFKVLSPGLHTTVQDLGRQGYQALGVPVSGALDGPSLRLANRLAGNADNAAALEILYQGPTLEVQAAHARVALAGGDATLELVGERSRTAGGWRSLLLREGERFRVNAAGASACCYLAIEGGVAVEPCLGSAATFTRGGFGGFAGRALRCGEIRVVLGPQADHFTAAALARLLDSEFRISKDADRMGVRLDGARLEHCCGYDIASDGIGGGGALAPGAGEGAPGSHGELRAGGHRRQFRSSAALQRQFDQRCGSGRRVSVRPSSPPEGGEATQREERWGNWQRRFG
jgi:allophanate hydrolase subunit 2